MTKLTLTEQEELFAKDCKLINLRYEYTNYTGKEKWVVITELTEKELRKKYPDIIKRYTPFVLLSMAQGEVINEAELIKLMEERADFKYITDIMPAANAEFAEKFAGRYFSTPKKMGAQTAEANINAGIAAAQQIVGFLKDGCEKFRVNK